MAEKKKNKACLGIQLSLCLKKRGKLDGEFYKARVCTSTKTTKQEDFT